MLSALCTSSPAASVPSTASAAASVSRGKVIEPRSCVQRLMMAKGICLPCSSTMAASANEPGNWITTRTFSVRAPGAGLNTTMGIGSRSCPACSDERRARVNLRHNAVDGLPNQAVADLLALSEAHVIFTMDLIDATATDAVMGMILQQELPGK